MKISEPFTTCVPSQNMSPFCEGQGFYNVTHATVVTVIKSAPTIYSPLLSMIISGLMCLVFEVSRASSSGAHACRDHFLNVFF